MFDAEPLRVELEAFFGRYTKARGYGRYEEEAHDRIGMRALAERYVERFGGVQANVERQLHRILAGESRTIGEEYADNFCTLLGLHPVLLWNVAWMTELGRVDVNGDPEHGQMSLGGVA